MWQKKKCTLFGLLVLALFTILINHNQNGGNQMHDLVTGVEAQAYAAFQQWLIQNPRAYRQQDQKVYRFRIFMANYKFVLQHNQKYKRREETFSLALNQFADLSNAQFKYLYVGYNSNNTSKNINTNSVAKSGSCKGTITKGKIPEFVSWKGVAVSDVRNQGQCGSCWAISACGALQGLDAIESGTIRNFSPQQLVDCSSIYGNQGCNGGNMDAAFWYVIDNGIALEQSYQYHAKDQKCTYDQSKMKAYQINDCADVPANKTDVLMSVVAKQPVAIAVQASTLFFQFYSKGVFNNTRCGQDLDHGILLTGYGSLGSQDYWECKNSWGTAWGMQGYILIQRDNQVEGGICGILMQNSIPLNRKKSSGGVK